MPGLPYLLDNLTDETTHAAALAYLIRDLPATHPIAVATGYVNLGGLHHLAVTVSDGRGVRLLLGAAPSPVWEGSFRSNDSNEPSECCRMNETLPGSRPAER